MTLVDLSTSSNFELLKDIHNYTQPQTPYLVMMNGNLLPNFATYLRTRPRFLNVAVIRMLDNQPSLVYQSQMGPEYTLVVKNAWTGQRLVFEGHNLLSKGRFSNLFGRVIHASAVIYPPFFNQVQDSNGNGLFQEGIEMELVKTITKSINAKLKVRTPTDGEFWGRDKDGDGKFDGMVGDLQFDRADLGFAQVFAKAERLSIMDFSLEYDYDYDAFLVLKPSPLPQIVAMVRPFKTSTWIWSVIVFGASCLFVGLYELFDVQNSLEGAKGILFLISATLMESNQLCHKWNTFTGRVFMATFLIGVFILSKGYSGGLVSFLTVPLTKKPINSIQGVVDAGLPTSSRGGSSFISYVSKSPLIMELRDSHQSHRDYDMAFKNFSRGEIILFQSLQLFQVEIRKRLTNEYGETRAHIVGDYPRFHRVALGLGKMSPLTAIVNDRVQKIKESGMIKFWTATAMERIGKLADSKSRPKNIVLGWNELEGHFLIWAICLAI
ncbi:hypothetical protein TCAL_14003, partial [Tigriopus californicus]